jgi:hypothetical protein
MKKFFKPLLDSAHKFYENRRHFPAPRARSKKIRKYEHVDISKEFEILTKRREAEKKEKLEELYDKYD